jgi:GT2 family glycosyltransferase
MPDVYERCAQAGIRAAAEPDSQVFAHAAAGSVARSYNLILERASAFDELEALVLLHQDLEVVDPDFCGKLRRALADPEVGVVGCVGAVGARGIAWWDGTVSWTSAEYRYGELGGGELSFNGGGPAPRTADVDTVYGVLLALSPWVVRNLRFDESLGPVHGYDFDLCAQVRSAGRKVLIADLEVAHHHSLDLVTETEPWVEAHMRVADKWEQPVPGGDEAWERRARRAEAEAAAARLLAASRLLQAYAWAEHNERQLKELASTTSWRVTRPLRRANALLRRVRERRRSVD